jgi:type II secretory pathway pseudopilin PulG
MKNKQAFGILQLLIAVAIIAILAGLFVSYGTGTGSDGESQSRIGQVKGKAESHVCQQYLKQLRDAIQMAMMDEYIPENLSDYDRIPVRMTKCPDSGEDYEYDPHSNPPTVQCKTFGHERL